MALLYREASKQAQQPTNNNQKKNAKAKAKSNASITNSSGSSSRIHTYTYARQSSAFVPPGGQSSSIIRHFCIYIFLQQWERRWGDRWGRDDKFCCSCLNIIINQPTKKHNQLLWLPKKEGEAVLISLYRSLSVHRETSKDGRFLLDPFQRLELRAEVLRLGVLDRYGK